MPFLVFNSNLSTFEYYPWKNSLKEIEEEKRKEKNLFEKSKKKSHKVKKYIKNKKGITTYKSDIFSKIPKYKEIF